MHQLISLTFFTSLLTMTNWRGDQTHYEYDLNNNRTAMVKPGGQRWEYDYDLGNRPISIRNVDQGIETGYSYDESDNLISITDAEGKVTQFAYDQRNRKVSKTYADDQQISYGYDENGNLTTVNNPNGTNITYAYDQLDRQITQSYSGSLGEASVSLTLDGNGNVVEVEETIGGEVYAASMDYDDWDRLILVTDRHDYSLQYTYDNNGNRTVLNDSQNTQSSYSFDKLNRLAQMVVAGTGTFAYSYNQAGLLEHIEYPKGESIFNYDDSVTHLTRKYLQQAGKKGSCHIFRHSMATLMLEHGADIRYIQAMLGHVNLNTTEIYTQVSINQLKEIHTATHPAKATSGGKLKTTHERITVNHKRQFKQDKS